MGPRDPMRAGVCRKEKENVRSHFIPRFVLEKFN